MSVHRQNECRQKKKKKKKSIGETSIDKTGVGKITSVAKWV